MAHLKDSILIGAPPEKVHAFAADVRKWPIWFVGLGEAESVEGDNSPGTVVKQSYTFMGVHIPVTTKVIENSVDADGGRHWRAENEGSLAGWHSWNYLPREDGTLVEVEMEYAVPGSVLGKVADRLFVERNQERALRHTLENLKQLTEA
jgi:coenzyme Q-binding protein COQ10